MRKEFSKICYKINAMESFFYFLIGSLVFLGGLSLSCLLYGKKEGYMQHLLMEFSGKKKYICLAVQSSPTLTPLSSCTRVAECLETCRTSPSQAPAAASTSARCKADSAFKMPATLCCTCVKNPQTKANISFLRIR